MSTLVLTKSQSRFLSASLSSLVSHIAIIIGGIRDSEPDVLSPHHCVGIGGPAGAQINSGNDISSLHRGSLGYSPPPPRWASQRPPLCVSVGPTLPVCASSSFRGPWVIKKTLGGRYLATIDREPAVLLPRPVTPAITLTRSGILSAAPARLFSSLLASPSYSIRRSDSEMPGRQDIIENRERSFLSHFFFSLAFCCLAFCTLILRRSILGYD